MHRIYKTSFLYYLKKRMGKETERTKLINFLCEKYNFDMLMIDSSDEEEEDEIQENFRMSLIHILSNRRSVHLGLPKSPAHHNKFSRNFDSKRFYQMVRITAAEFAHILNLIKNDKVFQTNSQKLQFPIELQLKIALCRLASCGNNASVRKIASLFGIGGGGTIQNITKRMFEAILKLKNKFLYWPNEMERLVLATKYQLPGCVGYIGGYEIRLAEAPCKSHELYFSHKRQYALKMQAVCDYKLRIRQVTIGYPGSVHDAKIFSSCPLGKYPQRYLSNGQWLAGDSIYPLKDFLITPFRKNSSEHSRESREIFNKYFAAYGIKIEKCFGLLKEKFCSLKELRFRLINERNKKECNDWIMVCCVLHNILINYNSEGSSNDEMLDDLSLGYIPRINNRNDLLHFIKNQSNGL